MRSGSLQVGSTPQSGDRVRPTRLLRVAPHWHTATSRVLDRRTCESSQGSAVTCDFPRATHHRYADPKRPHWRSAYGEALRTDLRRVEIAAPACVCPQPSRLAEPPDVRAASDNGRHLAHPDQPRSSH